MNYANAQKVIAACNAKLALRRASRTSFISYLKNVWWMPHPFIEGRHTRVMCDTVDTAIADYLQGQSVFLLVEVPFRHGKALHVRTPIPTPDGWTTMGALKPGDRVYASDGSVTSVVAKSPVWRNRELYNVSIDAGRDEVLADANHLWETKLDRRSHWAIHTTETLAKPRRHSVPVKMAGALKGETPNNGLPIPPYTLGVWLGDGDNLRGSVTSGDEDRAFIQAQLALDGFECTTQKIRNHYTVRGLSKLLRAEGLLHNKHIPMAYLRASYEDRFALLQGLIDTDGDVAEVRGRDGRTTALCGGSVTFSNTNKRLAYDALELVRTLGIKCSISSYRTKIYGRDCGEGFKVMFYLKDCCRIERKRERTRDATKFVKHSIRVTATGKKGDTVCIQVAHPSGMFLCGKSFTPTHNSDVFSRALPGYFLARCNMAGLDPDVMLTAYATPLVEGFSTDAKQIITSPAYINTFPTVRLAKGANNKGEWRLAGAYGKVVATGLGGGLTGKGYGLGIVDDYFKNREEAESETMREKVWEHIRDDFMTRRAPHSVTIIVATPWHVDGPGGRILKAMEEDPDFPRFRHIRLPARERIGDEMETLADGRVVPKYRYLFPERYPDDWYRSHYAMLGSYSAAGLLDCNPVPAEGNVARREWFPIVDAFPAGCDSRVRYWDLAATAKKTADYTCGCHMLKKDGIFYLTDIARSQTAAGGIRKLIQTTATQDGYDCPVRIEQEGGSAGKILSVDFAQALEGYEIYFNHPTGDKLTRALPFFAQAEAGNVRLVRGAWNKPFLDEVVEAPNGKNDDTWDSAAGAFYHLTRPEAG